MTLTQWAARWQINPSALVELVALLGVDMPPERKTVTGISESAVQQAVRLAVAKRGDRVWRNNSGAAQVTDGRMIRFGLGNDSEHTNKIFKSSDLIGITQVRCPCGHRYGVFTAYEVKRPGWSLTPGDSRAQAQFNFMKFIVSLGGIGRFVTNERDIE